MQGELSTKIELVKDTFWLEYFFIDDETLNITISAKTIGYLAIGFGSSMTNTDMIIGRMVADQPIILDMWSTGHVTPKEDSESNILSFSGSRSEGFSTFWFSRKLNTGDLSQDFVIIPNKPLGLIYSLGK